MAARSQRPIYHALQQASSSLLQPSNASPLRNEVELVPLRTLLSQQRRDPEAPNPRVAQVLKPEPDYQSVWRPETRAGGHAVPVLAHADSHAPGAPTTAHRFASLSRPRDDYIYETAQTRVQGQQISVPTNVAVARAQAIDAGQLGKKSTLYQFMASENERPSHGEKLSRMMVKCGAMSPHEAPVESRKERRSPAIVVPREMREIMVPEIAKLREGPAASQGPARVARAPRMRRQKEEASMKSGDRAASAVALPPSTAASRSSKQGLRRIPSDTILSEATASCRENSLPGSTSPGQSPTPSAASSTTLVSYTTALTSPPSSPRRYSRRTVARPQAPSAPDSSVTTLCPDSASPTTLKSSGNAQSAKSAHPARSPKGKQPAIPALVCRGDQCTCVRCIESRHHARLATSRIPERMQRLRHFSGDKSDRLSTEQIKERAQLSLSIDQLVRLEAETRKICATQPAGVVFEKALEGEKAAFKGLLRGFWTVEQMMRELGGECPKVEGEGDEEMEKASTKSRSVRSVVSRASGKVARMALGLEKRMQKSEV